MIEKIDGFGEDMFELVCDVCGDTADIPFESFYDAVSYKKDKDNGWTSRCIDDEWEDRCPSCT